jgi:hypothetical protein
MIVAITVPVTVPMPVTVPAPLFPPEIVPALTIVVNPVAIAIAIVAIGVAPASVTIDYDYLGPVAAVIICQRRARHGSQSKTRKYGKRQSQ